MIKTQPPKIGQAMNRQEMEEKGYKANGENWRGGDEVTEPAVREKKAPYRQKRTLPASPTARPAKEKWNLKTNLRGFLGAPRTVGKR